MIAREKKVHAIGPRPNTGRYATEHEALEAVVARLVEAHDPQAIWLFGSRARGDHRPDSDFDLLVVAKEGQTWGDDYRTVHGPISDTGVGCDVVPCSAEDFDIARLLPTTMVSKALAQGREVYSALSAITRDLSDTASLLPDGEKDRMRGVRRFNHERRNPLTLPSPPREEGKFGDADRAKAIAELNRKRIASFQRMARQELQSATLLSPTTPSCAVSCAERAVESLVLAVLEHEVIVSNKANGIGDLARLLPADHPWREPFVAIEHLSGDAALYQYPTAEGIVLEAKLEEVERDIAAVQFLFSGVSAWLPTASN
jgi:uncharacterized protein